MSKWIYQGQPLEAPPEGAFGFVYRISIGDEFYVGSKQFFSRKKVGLGKKESSIINEGKKGRKITKKKKVTEFKWQVYTSSSWDSEFKDRVRSSPETKWEILRIAYSKTELNYLEMQLLFQDNAFLQEGCKNKMMQMKIHKRNLQRLLDETQKSR